jgi:hypothetical protein
MYDQLKEKKKEIYTGSLWNFKLKTRLNKLGFGFISLTNLTFFSVTKPWRSSTKNIYTLE